MAIEHHNPDDASNRQSPIGNRQCLEVSAGLVFRGGRLLVTQRHVRAHQGGLWEFPGGKREPGETFEQCLQRELREELGIEVEVEELVETIVHEYPEKTVVLKFFRCLWLANEAQNLGCLDHRWIKLEELSQFDFPPADARLLEKLRNLSS